MENPTVALGKIVAKSLFSGWCFGTMEFDDLSIYIYIIIYIYTNIYIYIYWECDHPNCYSLHHFSEG